MDKYDKLPALIKTIQQKHNLNNCACLFEQLKFIMACRRNSIATTLVVTPSRKFST